MSEVVQSNAERLDALKDNKKFINKAFWTLNWTIPMCFTKERMLGESLMCMMLNCAEDIYPGDVDKQIELGMNHAVFFNTQQTLGMVVYGCVLGMEVERAKEPDVLPNEVIQSIKTALASPLAGLGDSLIQALITPILISIAIGMSSTDGSVMGPIFLFVSYCLINGIMSYSLFVSGFKFGVSSAEILMGSDVRERLIPAIENLGVIVIGAVLASTLSVQTALEFDINGTVVNIQTDVLDAIMPGLLSLIVALISYWLMKYKNVSITKLIVIFIPVAIIGYFTGILA